jgi:hypothetical protein
MPSRSLRLRQLAKGILAPQLVGVACLLRTSSDQRICNSDASLAHCQVREVTDSTEPELTSDQAQTKLSASWNVAQVAELRSTPAATCCVEFIDAPRLQGHSSGLPLGSLELVDSYHSVSSPGGKVVWTSADGSCNVSGRVWTVKSPSANNSKRTRDMGYGRSIGTSIM